MPSTAAFVLSLLGFLVALVTGWLGGELVYRLGIGVEHGANANAPVPWQSARSVRPLVAIASMPVERRATD